MPGKCILSKIILEEQGNKVGVGNNIEVKLAGGIQIKGVITNINKDMVTISGNE